MYDAVSLPLRQRLRALLNACMHVFSGHVYKLDTFPQPRRHQVTVQRARALAPAETLVRNP